MTSQEHQILVFQIGDEQFAADISGLREIASWQPVRRIPRAPAFLAGVVDLRNREIIPIIDLHDRLELPLNVPEEKQRIIIAPVERQFVGFLVDAVRDVLTVKQEQIAPPPSVGDDSPPFLSGVLRTDDGIILLLEIERILTSDEKLRIAELKESLGSAKKQTDEAAQTTPKKPARKKKSATAKKTSDEDQSAPARKATRRRKTSTDTTKKRSTRKKSSGKREDDQ